jgi:hypothetical protein
VVSSHHLLVISSEKPLYNGKFIFKIIPEVISKVRYFSQMYKKSRGCSLSGYDQHPSPRPQLNNFSHHRSEQFITHCIKAQRTHTDNFHFVV